MSNRQLSAHFWERELACRGLDCCDNTCVVHPYLLMALEQLRTLARRPIIIKSGFRCNRHNAETPGAAHESYHTRGEAVDVQILGMDAQQVAVLAAGIDAFRHGGIGLYPTWVHLDIGEKRRWRGK